MYYMFFFFFSSRRRHTRFSRDWSSDVCSSDLREVLAEWGRRQVVVVVGPGLVVVTDVRQHRVGEDREELPHPAAGLELDAAARRPDPAALPLLLILVAAGVTLARSGLDVVEPDVLDA